MKDEKRKRRGLKGFLNANDFHDAIETYRRRVEDLKMDFFGITYFFQRARWWSDHFMIIIIDPCHWRLFADAVRFDC